MSKIFCFSKILRSVPGSKSSSSATEGNARVGFHMSGTNNTSQGIPKWVYIRVESPTSHGNEMFMGLFVFFIQNGFNLRSGGKKILTNVQLLKLQM